MLPIRDHNPSATTPVVTWALIALNVAIHVWSVLAIQTDAGLYRLYDAYALVPAEISAGQEWTTLVTSTFLHAGWLHLGGNMLFLWIFGDNAEEALGPLRFLLFYLASGVGAGLCQWGAVPQSTVFTVGASGAIAGVMGGYLLLFPRAKVDILIFLIIIRIIPVPAWAMLGVWFGLQVFNGLGDTGAGGGVAYWAHAGGFAIGLALMVPAWVRRGGPGFWAQTDGRPPHADAAYGTLTPTRVPAVRRR
jgi:membrane associated rhomboid family serine protease